VTVVGGRQVAIFNLGGRFLAVNNRCPHRGGPLAEGIISGTTVVCPLHAWKIDLETGEIANPQSLVACVSTFPTRISGGIVELLIASNSEEGEPVPEDRAHRDRPLRWVQRKPSAPISTTSEVL
jgi:nitrite reductase (NADH) small subunit